VKLPLYLHTDACQAAGYLDLSVARLGIDLLSLNGSKIYGPRGSGLLYIKHGTQLEALIYGGGQERGRRSGTENVAAAVGLGEALEQAQMRRAAETQHLAPLRDGLLKQLIATIPNSLVNGDMKHRLPGNLNLTFPGLDGQSLVLYLDQAGIMASTGSACSSGDQEPSHVLLALGRSETEASASLRLTLGRGTTADELAYVAEQLPPIVARLRQIA
jgi:cysteine desulfurase